VTAETAAHMRLTAELAASFAAQQRTTVTWLNHSSAITVVTTAADEIAQVDVVGVDGLFLKMLVGAAERTSADLVMPVLLPQLAGARIAVLGGTPSSLAGAVAALPSLLGLGASIVVARDGYNGLPDDEELGQLLRAHEIDVVLLGLGAGLQERKAVACARHMNRGLIMTCGGFLDQVQQDNYYPSWAYPLRLNWLVRLAREPRRLYRRYTYEAWAAWRMREMLRDRLRNLPGVARAEALSTGRDVDAVRRDLGRSR
jgi:UDP-N-acetyl-D-mannosaminuronic acid transferase (WecB/TagA/CpsF family)